MIANVHERACKHATQLAETLLGEDQAKIVQIGVGSDAGDRNRLRTDELMITPLRRADTVAFSA